MKCKFCGDEFEKNSQKKQKYCSAECRKKWWLRVQKEKINSNIKEIPCKRCGKVFKQRRSSQVFCCKNCADKDYQKQKRVMSKCEQCGKEIISKYKRKYCNDCWNNTKKSILEGGIIRKTIRSDIKILKEIDSYNKTHDDLYDFTRNTRGYQTYRLYQDGFIDVVGKGAHRKCGLTIPGILMLEGEKDG